jgi:hypothetical protein
MEFARKVWKLLVAIKDGMVPDFLPVTFDLMHSDLSRWPGLAGWALVPKLDGPLPRRGHW